MTAPARTAAYYALRDVTAQAHDLPAALAHSRRALTDDRDRALAAEIVTGSLRWLRSLDALIEHFAKRPPTKIDGSPGMGSSQPKRGFASTTKRPP
jgi:hypothetical protein